jgi:hypothetical protein
VLGAAHSRRVGLHERPGEAKIERASAPAAVAEIEPRAAAPTDPAAIALSGARAGRHDHVPLLAEEHVFDHRGAQPEQPRP